MGDRVQVAVRVRPLNRREIDLGSHVIVDMDDNQTTLRHPKWAAKLAKNSKESIKKYEPKTFAFDFCFWSIDEQDTAKFAGQEKVFEHVGGAILARAFEGYNACILAYGQTGSGKSYSMMGSHEQKGIIPRFCESLFQRVGQNVSGHVSFRILVSYMEIYNEKVRDLLEPGSKHNLTVREHSVLGPYVDGLLQLAVESYKEVECLLTEGTKSRTVAATNMNSESSRSHAVFTITLVRTQTDMKTGTVSERVSRINLVDLAGSERASKTGSIGERLREGGNINRSLTTLGLVVKALAERSGKHQAKFVPYRDSVLTWLLKDSLGGNSKTVMLALVSPAADNYEESLSTLRYADSAKHIVNNAVVNEDPNSRIIRELRHEIDELRQRLSQAETVKAPHLKEQLNLSERLMMDICKPWEERLQETERIQRERQGTLEAMGIHVESSGIKVDSGRCFLVNLNADPSLNELLVYYLKAHTRVGRVAGGGQIGSGIAEDAPDIQLEGIGIMPDHCTLEVEQSKVYVTPGADGGARTCINGTAIFSRTRARHGDRILWGNNHFFRLNCPKDDDESTCNLLNETRNRRSAEYELAQEELMQQEMAENPIHFAIEGMERQLSSRLTSSSALSPAGESKNGKGENSTVANLSSSNRSQWPVMPSGLANASWTGLIEDDSTAGVEISGNSSQCLTVAHAKNKGNRCATDVHRLAYLRKELYRAHSFAREANMLAGLVPWCDVVYEVSLQIPACDLSPNLQRLRNGLESRPAIMARRRAHAEQKQLFTMNEFEGRLVAMRELCLGTDGDRDSVVPQPSDESDDNPFTVSNAWHDLIGVANVFLDALFHEVALDHWVVIVSQYGEVAGRLHVVLTKAGDGLTRRSDDDDHYEHGRSDSDQPSSTTSSTKKITVKVSIKEAKGLPSDLANFVFCQYRFWNSSKLVSVPPAMAEPDDDDVTESALRSDPTSVKFDHIQDFVVDVTEDFVDYVSGGNALSIEVYGHRRDVAAMQAASGTTSPRTKQFNAEPTSTLAARWAEVTCRVDLCVQVLELGETGQYEPVELRQLEDVACGGVFQLRQGFSRRLRVDIACPPDGGRLPVASVSIESVCIGGICLRSQSQRGLDSYHEQGLELLRQRWHAALDRRRTYLSSKTARTQTGEGSDDAGSNGDTTPSNLKVAWDELISEMDAVCSPAAGSGVPGAPMMATRKTKASSAEQHIPVVFLDLRDVDDRSADEPPDLFDSVSESDSEEPAVGHAIGEQWLLDKEEGTTFIQLPLVQRSEGGTSGTSGGSGLRSSAVASWDSTLHDSVHLNMVTLPGERVYLTAKVYVRLGLHPEPSVVVFRKRICVCIFRTSSLSYKLRKSIGSPRGSPLAAIGSSSTNARSWGSDGCSATFEVVSSIPKALNQLERGEILARLAASSSECGEADSCVELSAPPGRSSNRSFEGVVDDGIGTSGRSYIEQYLRSIAAIESMILADKAGQEAAVKESLCRAGRSLRRFGSTPNVGSVDRSSRYLFSPRGEAVTPPLLQSRLAMSVRDLSKSRSPAWSDSSSSAASAMTGGRFLRQTFVEADSLAALPTYPEATDEDMSPSKEARNSTSTPRFRASRATAGSSHSSASRSSATAMPMKPGASRLSFLSCVGIPATGEGSDDEDDAYMPSAALSSAKDPPQLLVSFDQRRMGANVIAGERTSAVSQEPAERAPTLSPGSPTEAATPGVGQGVSASKRSGSSESDTATSIVRPVNHCTQQDVDAAAVSAPNGSCHIVPGGLHSVRETGGAPTADSSSSLEQVCPSGGRLSGVLELPIRTFDSKSNAADSSGFATGASNSQTQPITSCRPASATAADDSSHRATADGGDATTSIRVSPTLMEWHEDRRFAPEQRDRDQAQPFEAMEQQELQQQQQQQTSAGDHSFTPRSRLELISDPYSLTALDCLEAAEQSGGSNDGFGSDDEDAAGARWAAVVNRGSSAGQQHGTTVVTVRGGRLRSPDAGDSDSGDSDGNSECSFGSLADLIASGDDAVQPWLQRGASVVVLSTRGKPPRIGTVRSIGEAVIAPGKWVGVQFDDPVGKNDGSVRGVRYFRCPPRHGIFVRPDRVLPNRKDKFREADKQKDTTSGIEQHVAVTSTATSGRCSGTSRTSADFLASSESNGRGCPADCRSVIEKKRDSDLATERSLSAQPAANADEPELWLPLPACGAASCHGVSDAAQCDTAERLRSGEAATSTGQEKSGTVPPAAFSGSSRPFDTVVATLAIPATGTAGVRSSNDAGAAFLPDVCYAVTVAPTHPLAPVPATAAASAALTASGLITMSPASESQSAAMLSRSSAADVASEINLKHADAATGSGSVLSLALRADASHTAEHVQRSAVDTSAAGSTSAVPRADASSTAASAKAAAPALTSAAVTSVDCSIAATAAVSSSAATAAATASAAAAAPITVSITSVSHATGGVGSLLQRSVTAAAADSDRSATAAGTVTIARTTVAAPAAASDAAVSGASIVARMTALASSKTVSTTTVTSADDFAVSSRSAIDDSFATAWGRPVSKLSAAALPSPGERAHCTGASNAEQYISKSTAGVPGAAHGSESPPAASATAETPSPVFCSGARASTLRIPPAAASNAVVAVDDRSPVKLLRGAADAGGRQKSAGSASQTLARLESGDRSGRTSPAPSGDGAEPEEVRLQQRKGSFKKLKVPSFMKPTSSSSSKKK